MKKVLNLLIVTFIASLILSSTSFAADTKGLIIDGRTLVPVRGVFEELGFNVIWDAETQTAFLADSSYTVKIQKGADTFTTNTETITPEVPQQVISDSFYLPLRAIADSIGASTKWDNDNKVAIINYNNKTAYVFCGNITSSEYFKNDNLSSQNNGSSEDMTESTTAEISEPQSVRNISVDRDEDQNLSVSFLPDDINDYSKTSETVNIYLYNKLDKLIYENSRGINITDNSDYIDFDIRYNDLKNAVKADDLKSYTHCVLKIEILADNKVYAKGEYTFSEMFSYSTGYSDNSYDIDVEFISSRMDIKNKIIARFKVSGEEYGNPVYNDKLYFVSYDFDGNKLDSVPIAFVSGSDFEQDYTFSGDTAYILIETR